MRAKQWHCYISVGPSQCDKLLVGVEQCFSLSRQHHWSDSFNATNYLTCGVEAKPEPNLAQVVSRTILDQNTQTCLKFQNIKANIQVNSSSLCEICVLNALQEIFKECLTTLLTSIEVIYSRYTQSLSGACCCGTLRL